MSPLSCRCAVLLLALVLPNLICSLKLLDEGDPTPLRSGKKARSPFHEPGPVRHHFLQVSDIHYDGRYKNGGSTKFGCHTIPTIKLRRMDHGKQKLTGDLFGVRSRCDTPPTLLNSTWRTLQEMITAWNVDTDQNPAAPSKDKPYEPLFKFVLWTGDTVRHDNDPSHPKSLNRSISDIAYVAAGFQTLFQPENHHTIVIPSIGNQDVFPSNELAPPPCVQCARLLEAMKGLFPPQGEMDPLAPDNDPAGDFAHGGYFYRQVDKGLRVVSLNTVYMYIKNSKATDCSLEDSPGGAQLDWLEKVLKDSTKAHHSVYITGHVPPGDQWKKGCYARYVSLASRFSATIHANMFAHMNADTITLLKDSTTHKNVAVVLNNPSLIPVYNPAFRVYRYEPATGILLGYTQFYSDLDYGNRLKYISFSEEYDTNAAYGLSDLTLPSLEAFERRVKSDPSLQQLTEQFRYVSSKMAALQAQEEDEEEESFDNARHSDGPGERTFIAPIGVAGNVQDQTVALASAHAGINGTTAAQQKASNSTGPVNAEIHLEHPV